MQQHRFDCGGIACSITVSNGISSIGEGAIRDMEQLLSMADQALYRAKKMRNYMAINRIKSLIAEMTLIKMPAGT